MSLGAKIRSWRRAAKLTQEQLANKLPVNLRTIQNWEGDKTSISLEDLILLANVLDVPEADRLALFNPTPSHQE